MQRDPTLLIVLYKNKCSSHLLFYSLVLGDLLQHYFYTREFPLTYQQRKMLTEVFKENLKKGETKK